MSICMSVCMHAADTHALSLTGTLHIQFGRASAPWYCQKILIIKYRLSRPSAVTPFPDWKR